MMANHNFPERVPFIKGGGVLNRPEEGMPQNSIIHLRNTPFFDVMRIAEIEAGPGKHGVFVAMRGDDIEDPAHPMDAREFNRMLGSDSLVRQGAAFVGRWQYIARKKRGQYVYSLAYLGAEGGDV